MQTFSSPGQTHMLNYRPMPDPAQQSATGRRSNSALWLGLLITILGILSNFLYFVKFPQGIIPWINLIIPLIGLVLLFTGLRRAFGQAQVYRGKIWGSIVTVLSVLLFAVSVWGFVHARAVPRSPGAPQVGQRVPDFTLPDSAGQPVSFSQLFSNSPGGTPPKAVLLIFYRGYW